MTIANKLQYKVQNDFKHDCLLAMDLYQGESIAIVAAAIRIAVNSGHISAVFLEEVIMEAYPFKKYSTTVPNDWVDFNGHMNTKYYGLVIYDAHIDFTEHLDLGERYRYANNCSKALVESHCIFERELCEGDEIEVVSWLLSVDGKRLHTFHEIYCTNKGYRAAAGEHLDVHIDLETRRVSPFPQAVLQRLQLIEKQYAQFPKPNKVGSTIKAPVK